MALPTNPDKNETPSSYRRAVPLPALLPSSAAAAALPNARTEAERRAFLCDALDTALTLASNCQILMAEQTQDQTEDDGAASTRSSAPSTEGGASQ